MAAPNTAAEFVRAAVTSPEVNAEREYQAKARNKVLILGETAAPKKPSQAGSLLAPPTRKRRYHSQEGLSHATAYQEQLEYQRSVLEKHAKIRPRTGWEYWAEVKPELARS